MKKIKQTRFLSVNLHDDGVADPDQRADRFDVSVLVKIIG